MPPKGRPKWETHGRDRSSQARLRETIRSLDNIPIRNNFPRTLHEHVADDFDVPLVPEADDVDYHPPAGEAIASQAQLRTVQPVAPPPSQSRSCDDESYSPTASEFDALEESFYDYETQSNLETVSTTNASSANYIQDSETQSLVSYSTLPSSIDKGPGLEPRIYESLEDRLGLVWPKSIPGLESVPFAVLWEVTRVALHCNIQLPRLDLPRGLQDTWQDYDLFWAKLQGIPPLRGCKFPGKSDPGAWRMCFEPPSGNEAVVLTATMHATKSRRGPMMRLELHPLKREQSSRLFRHFGSHRYLEVRIPSVDSWLCDASDAEAAAARWLTGAPHEFLGRRWSAFYVRDRQLKVDAPDPSPRAESKPVFYDRVLLFAEKGKGLLEAQVPARVASNSASSQEMDAYSASSMACSRNSMLDWLLNWQENGNQKYLKLFHRVALGLSKTKPIVILQHDQIRHHSKDIQSPTGEVMNDGAGRISVSLMRKVRDALGLQTLPSAIQGRLGSAKGMWLMDFSDLSHDDWIETYPSQRKWECDSSHEEHRTLEVRSWSTELVPASLNIQFLPILEDRAVDVDGMRAAFVDNMVTESEAEVEALKSALQHPELFRKWVRQTSPPQMGSRRLVNRAVPFLGGLPDSEDDLMSFLVDGGFEPMQFRFLQDLVFQRQRQKGIRMKEGLRINLAKSTYAYMLVDFWGVLEPGEVHLCFSRFDDGDGELSDLDGVSVLVARAPAHLPSDIQKVKAVFKPELRHLRDVIIFSAKGDVPLAAKLSGGDYDGDKAWVCWDPEIVNNFENHPVPPGPDFTKYLKKDGTTLADLRKEHGSHRYVDAMLKQAFHFNLKKQFLGPCTAYKERMCYHRYRISDQQTIKLSWLLSELADQPKQGITFGQEAWNRFRDDVVGTRREFAPPAYKTGGLPRAATPTDGRALHIIDFLMDRATRVVDGALTDLHRFLQASGASTTDRAVAGHWDRFEASFGGAGPDGRPRHAWFPALRDGLRTDVDACLAAWNGLVGDARSDYAEKVRLAHEKWRAIAPRLPPAGGGGRDDAALLAGLLGLRGQADLDDDGGGGGGGLPAPELGRWELLKASFAFKHHHRRRFVWQMAGRQLQHLKALAAAAGSVLVAPGMYAALRTDNLYVKRLMAHIADGDPGVFVNHDDEPDGGAGLGELPWTSSPAGEE